MEVKTLTSPIRILLQEYADNNGWYNGQKILPYFDDAMLMMIIGARRIGKTDLFLRLACDLWQRFNLKTMWVRNKLTELKEPSFFNDFLNDAKSLGWCPNTWTVRPDGVHPDEDKGSDAVIKFQSISTFSNRRGGAHPDVIMLVFDEMMPEDRRYPHMCAEGLLSITKTVFSGNTDARCFCLSNYVSAANPYFVKLRVYPAKDRDVTVFRDKAVLIERCRGYKCAILEDNPWNRVYKAAGVGNYADEEEDELIKLIKPPPKGAKPQPYLIQSDGLLYRGWEKNGLIYYAEYRGDTKDIHIWTPNLKECSDRVKLIIPFMKKDIELNMQTGSLRFKNPNVMFVILNMVFETV